jgi:hypothetical protein
MGMARLLRITVTFLAIVLSNWLVTRLTGYSLIGSDLFIIIFLGFVVIFVFASIWRI